MIVLASDFRSYGHVFVLGTLHLVFTIFPSPVGTGTGTIHTTNRQVLECGDLPVLLHLCNLFSMAAPISRRK
jgi:hypothetical protein